MDVASTERRRRAILGHRARVWITGAIVLGLVAVFLGLTRQVFWEDSDDREQVRAAEVAVFQAVDSYRTPNLNAMAINITALGSTIVLMIVVFVTLVIMAMRKDRHGFVLMGAASLGASLGTLLLKGLFDRARPDVIPALSEAVGYSYPSGHSFGAAAIYLSLAALLGRDLPKTRHRIGLMIIAGVVVFGVGLSRVYLGVHWPTDVAAGVALGTAWALAVGAASLSLRSHEGEGAKAKANAKAKPPEPEPT